MRIIRLGKICAFFNEGVIHSPHLSASAVSALLWAAIQMAVFFLHNVNEFYVLQNEILVSRKMFYLCWKRFIYVEKSKSGLVWNETMNSNITSSCKDLPSTLLCENYPGQNKGASGSLDSRVTPTVRRCMSTLNTWWRQMTNFSTYSNEFYVWEKFANFNEFYNGMNVRNNCVWGASRPS